MSDIASWFLPITHVVDIYPRLLSGDLHWNHLGDIAWLLVVCALFFGLALLIHPEAASRVR